MKKFIVGKHERKVDVTAADPTGYGHPTVLLVQGRHWNGEPKGPIKAITGWGATAEPGEMVQVTLDTFTVGYRDLGRFEVLGFINVSEGERSIPSGCPKRVPGYFLD